MRLVISVVIMAAMPAVAQEGPGDRRVIDSYPTLTVSPDQAGPLDGANPNAESQAAEDSTLAAMMTVLAPRGCVVGPDEVAQVFSPEGFTHEEVSTRLTGLYVNGVSGLDAEGRMTFPAALCPPDQPAASPRGRVVEAFRQAESCRLSEEDVRAALPDLSEERLVDLLTPLFDTGDLTIGPFHATLSDALCDT